MATTTRERDYVNVSQSDDASELHEDAALTIPNTVTRSIDLLPKRSMKAKLGNPNTKFVAPTTMETAVA